MPNLYFQFKQFIVYHDKCAMKVGTDGVLLGGWADVASAEKILDIGCGSGLIALMLAQRSTAHVIGIDISENAFVQTQENIARSPWKDRVEAIHVPLQGFARDYVGEKFDLIASNPPYFVRSLQPLTHDRLLARHTEELSLGQLLMDAEKLLSTNGRICLVLPSDQLAAVESEAGRIGLGISKLVWVSTKPGKVTKRILVQLERNATSMEESDFIIEETGGGYSPQFKEMLKDFYLSF